MNVDQTYSSQRKMKHFVFYRYQAFSGFVLFIGLGLGISILFALVNSAEVRVSISLFLVIFGILLAASQLLTIAFSFSTTLKPLEQISASMNTWVENILGKQPGDVSIQVIRDAIGSFEKLSSEYCGKLPQELEQLKAAYIHTLKLMESAWQKVEKDAIMVGMGGVCAQVAHDIRGPVSSIKVLSQAILDAGTPAEKKEMADAMTLSANRLNTMADELLSYRKASAIEMKPADLSAIVRDVCRQMQAVAQGKNVQLELDIPPDQEFTGDAEKMGRVLQNLVSNAVQAVEKHGGGQVRVALRRDGDRIALNIRDNGPGIPEQHVGKMFQEGFTTKGANGNGLGLIYCATVVKGHGGQIAARNHEDGGAEIAISLPYEVMQ